MSTFIPKPVEFKFGEYINKGFELFKKDMGTFILAFIFVLIMSLIPFCGFLGIGNFLKLARKINHGQQTSASEIFNFDDFEFDETFRFEGNTDPEQIQVDLEKHIRFEDRVLFEKIQNAASPENMEAIKKLHSSEKFIDNSTDVFWE